MEKELKNQPFDEESLKLLSTLPKRLPFINVLLTLLRLLSILILGFGGIGFAKVFFEWNNDDKIETSRWFFMVLLVGGVLAIGGILYYIAEYYLFKKAPIGNLVQFIFEGIQRKKIDKIRGIAQNIVTKTEDIGNQNKSYLFARIFALDVLSEITEEKENAAKWALKAIQLCKELIEAGIKTPMIYFILGNTGRIANEKEIAIHAYTEYLTLQPSDNQTRSILESLIGKKFINQSEQKKPHDEIPNCPNGHGPL